MKALALGAVVILLAGCGVSHKHAPLIFGQAHSLGVVAGTNPANQTPEISVGFKDIDIAVVPTIARDALGDPVLIQGGTAVDRDAYSTFGQFESSTATNQVGLGKFFATGIAARRLSDGFACKVSNGTEGKCTGRPAGG